MLSSLTQITQVRLINLRWLSVLGMVAAALVSPNILGSSDLMPRLLAFATVIGSINVCLLVAATIYRSSADGLPMFSPLVQLTFDLAAWGSYIYLSGGATNPLISIFLPLAAIGAIVLSKAQAWFLGMAVIAAYSFLWRFYQPLAIGDAETATHLHLLGMWLVFVVSAVVLIWFILQMTQAIRERDAALGAAREQAIRNDWLISMGSLAAGAAHELSTPLATLNMLVDELREDDGLPAVLLPDLALMQRQLEVCKLALTRLTERAGHPRGAPESGVPAAGRLRNVLDAWLALNPTAALTTEIGAELDDYLAPFDLAIERAITNLLDNALHAGALHIALQARLVGRWLVLSIKDDGQGISAGALQAFSAGQPIISENGMGIGLLIARAAIEHRGGKLELGRPAGPGTEARISIPCHKTQEAKHGQG
ncbi:MAG: ATP-binding protein [Azonexus sp.]